MLLRMDKLVHQSCAKKACEIVGNGTALAAKLSEKARRHVSQQTVSSWVCGGACVPVSLMAAIEDVTGYVVMREHFQPSDWDVIWPELKSLPERRISKREDLLGVSSIEVRVSPGGG